MSDISLDTKLDKAKETLRSLRRVAVGYSAGVDSTLLLKLAADVLGADNVIAVTAVDRKLSAYRYADHVVRPDGNKVPLPKGISGGAVLHIHPDNYELIPLRCDEEVFEYFKVLRQQFGWSEFSKSVVGKPLAPLF